MFISLYARENPFFSTKGENDIIYSSNKSIEKAPLKRATISLPSHARILKKVTIQYKNLDGSLETKSIELDNSIDWHLPIFISQSYGVAREEPKKLVKQSKIKSKNKVKKIIKLKYKKIASIKYAQFYSFGKSLKIITKDKKIRDFLLTDPHRIVIDFKRESNMKSFSKTYKNVFKKIRVGNHKDYYRVVLELDGTYRYDMQKISNGYIFKLR